LVIERNLITSTQDGIKCAELHALSLLIVVLGWSVHPILTRVLTVINHSKNSHKNWDSNPNYPRTFFKP